jgi:hypothetical protein
MAGTVAAAGGEAGEWRQTRELLVSGESTAK